ncbi:MAG: hypothetical protein CVU58_00165 [Deltaproteobacteria bacterium HGW-Deltaproteobacteria-16]|nr:MAG: hypothetical protein CVU58_00165 [Deltaproteobacteria bacterium HGW-Deltaproteobacteria-16]
MADIGNAKLQGQSFNAMRAQYAKVQPAGEKRGQGSEKVTTLEASLAMQEKTVDFLLAAKTKAKDRFATQYGLVKRGGEETRDLESFQYKGKSLADLSPEEAQTLIAEDGYFGVTKTAERLAGFVLTGAGDSLERLQAGREGIQKGFEEAEQAWGGKLPEISYQTLNKALEMIDARIQELGGGALVDVKA